MAKKGLGTMFKSLQTLLKKPKLSLGIDIGSSSIKAVVLSKTKQGIRFVYAAFIPIISDVIHSGEQDTVAELEQALRQLKSSIPCAINSAVIAITGSEVITKVIQVDRSLTELEIEYFLYGNLKLVTEKVVGQVNIDFVALGANEDDDGLQDIFVVVAKQSLINKRILALKHSGLQCEVVDLESHAIMRSLLMQYQLTRGDAVSVNIHIGQHTTILIVITKGKLVFSRELSIGAKDLTNKSRDSLGGLDQNKCRQTPNNPLNVQINPELKFMPFNGDGRLNLVKVSHLTDQLKQSVKSYSAIFDDQPIDYWFASGGGAQSKGLVCLLAKQLQIQLSLCQPLHQVSALNQQAEQARIDALPKQSCFQIALGLAIRGMI